MAHHTWLCPSRSGAAPAADRWPAQRPPRACRVTSDSQPADIGNHQFREFFGQKAYSHRKVGRLVSEALLTSKAGSTKRGPACSASHVAPVHAWMGRDWKAAGCPPAWPFVQLQPDILALDCTTRTCTSRCVPLVLQHAERIVVTPAMLDGATVTV